MESVAAKGKGLQITCLGTGLCSIFTHSVTLSKMFNLSKSLFPHL